VTSAQAWGDLNSRIIRCTACPRLVEWREQVSARRTRRFADQPYWGRPVPGFGDPNARLLLVGLAPAAHGANRTGRMFTGDRSGDWLYRALHSYGFANSPVSASADDGLRLRDCFITAACRCAPPGNKPNPEEFRNCRHFISEEFGLLRHVRIILGLGKLGFDAARAFLKEANITPQDSPRFSHGCVVLYSSGIRLLGCYHPSQQNTFTGRLTKPMFHAVFRRVRSMLDES